MNPILSFVLHLVEDNPNLLASLANLGGPPMVAMLLHFLPSGPMRTYAEAHPDEVLAFVREAVALVTKHPELVKAAAGQFKVQR